MGIIVFLLSVGLKSAPLVCRSVEEGAEEKPMVEEGSITEQQLGLRQAEERLYRDYIHRLLKVKKQAPYTLNLCLSLIHDAGVIAYIRNSFWHHMSQHFPLCLFVAVPRVPKLPVFMQALFCAHREHPRSTQAHQGEETQEKHHG